METTVTEEEFRTGVAEQNQEAAASIPDVENPKTEEGAQAGAALTLSPEESATPVENAPALAEQESTADLVGNDADGALSNLSDGTNGQNLEAGSVLPMEPMTSTVSPDAYIEQGVTEAADGVTVAPEGYATSTAATLEVSPSIIGSKPIMQVAPEDAADVPAPELDVAKKAVEA